MMTKTVVFAVLLAVVFASSGAAADKVKALKEANFDVQVEKTEFLMVEFYAPWCGHCKRFEPEYEEAAGMLDDVAESKAALTKVDCDDQRELCDRYGIRSYPSIRLLRNGKAEEYEGPRTTEAVVEFMRDVIEGREVETFSVELTPDNFDDFIEANPHVMVEFYAPWCAACQSLKKDYEGAAKIMEGKVPFALINCDKRENEELKKRFGISGYPTLKVFKDGVAEDYNGLRQAEAMVAHMEMVVNPGNDLDVVDLDDDSFFDALEKHEVALIMMRTTHCRLCDKWKAQFTRAASLLKGKALVGQLSADNRRAMEKVGINRFPTLIIFKNGKQVGEYNGDVLAPKIHDHIMEYVN